MWQSKTFLQLFIRQIVLLFVFGWINATAQPTQPVRLEIEASANSEDFHVIPLPDSSLLVYKHVLPYFSRPGKHTLSKYNSQLATRWTTEADLPEELKLAAYQTEGKRIYLLFLPRKADKVSIMILNTETAANVLYEYQAPEVIELIEFQVLGNYAFLAVKNLQQYVRLLHINLSENEGRFLPAVFAPEGSLCDFRVDPERMRAAVVLAENYKNKARLQVREFIPDGELVSTHFIFDRDQYNIRDGRLLPGDSTHKLLIGTFGNRDLRYHQGFFSTFLNGNNQDLKFYKFIDFKRFFDYMAPRTNRRILKKTARLKSREKNYLVRSRLLLHKPIPHDSGYFIIAEAYAIQYNYQPAMETFRPAAPNRVFNGYRRTAAIICNFDKSGNLTWENSYPIRDITTFELYPTVSAGFDQDSVYLAYLSDSRIKYKSVYKNAETPNDLETKVMTYHPSDRVSSSHSEQLVSWYGANFIVYGFQRIRSVNQSTRQVFYINKISFSDQVKPEQP